MVFTRETKTISARIPEDVHADILDRCNKEGCTVNHFLNCAIELAITGYSEFDFGYQEDEEERELPVTTPAKHVVISLASNDMQEDRGCSHSS